MSDTDKLIKEIRVLKNKSSDGQWQLAFWVITAICGIWLLTLTTEVINNDRLRVSDNKDMMAKVESYRMERTSQIADIMSKITSQYTMIIERLAKIETKLEPKR